METIGIFLQLFCTFFLIGMFTFGGGYAMLSLIQTEVVVTHGWLTEGTFANIIAISQMTPGPIGINCATYTGYEVLRSAGAGYLTGVLGSLTATLALVLPSFLIVLALVKFYQKFLGNRVFQGVMSALRPAVCGLIGAAALILIFNVSWNGPVPHFTLLRENFPDWKSWVLFAAAFISSMWTKINPIVIIVAGGVMGLILY